MRAVKFKRASGGFIRSLAFVLSLVLVTGQLFAVSAQRKPKPKNHQMSADQRIAHVLSRLTFGARPGDFERVKAMGVEAFINEQLDPDSIDASAALARLRKLPTLGMATPVLIEQYTPPKPSAVPSPTPAKAPDNKTTQVSLISEKNEAGKNEMQMSPKREDASMSAPGTDSMKGPEAMKPSLPQEKPAAAKPTPAPKTPQMVVTELQRAKVLRAVYSDRQLYEVIVDFWENHFNVFANKDNDRYLLTAYDRETIRPFATGRFRDLLGASAHSPAMLFYLDNWRSSVPRPYAATKDKPAGIDGGFNENYARELMELHTLGVDDGYTQKDVLEVARCFSGWTIQKPNEQGLFLYRPGFHDDGEKIVLGHRILPGGGMADGERVLDILAAHPATARFIATKLARRFISDNPPQSVIDRAAVVFLKTDGSIRETLRAIVTSPEFFSDTTYRAKLRSPFEYVAAAMRALNAETDGDRPVLDAIARMGQPLFGRITPDGYADRSDQWLSSGAMIARFNFAGSLASNRLKGTKIDVGRLVSGVDQANKDSVAAKFILITVSDDLSQATRTVLEKALQSQAAAAPPLKPGTGLPVGYDSAAVKASGPAPAYINELITLLLGSPEFQQR